MVAAVARALPGAGAARKWAVEVMADAAGPYLIACGVGWDEERFDSREGGSGAGGRLARLCAAKTRQ